LNSADDMKRAMSETLVSPKPSIPGATGTRHEPGLWSSEAKFDSRIREITSIVLLIAVTLLGGYFSYLLVYLSIKGKPTTDANWFLRVIVLPVSKTFAELPKGEIPYSYNRDIC
jgi:hypothetical protein